MKVELTKEQIKSIKAAAEKNPVYRWLKIKDEMKFEVGDVLIKSVKRHNWETKEDHWINENINSDNKMAKRYVYVHEDEFGIGYIKTLKVSNGALGKELFCLTDFDYDRTQFQVDPEYAEHTLLDAEYNIKDIHKRSLESRKLISKANRKIGKRLNTLEDYNKFFETLKKGDKFWTSHDYNGKHTQQYTVVSISKKSTADLQLQNPWWWKQWKEKRPVSYLNSSDIYHIDYKDNGYYGNSSKFVIEFVGLFYKQEPGKEDKK